MSSGSYIWSNELTEKLIVLYQECTNLYDSNDSAYNDSETRAATFDDIFDELKKFDYELSIENVFEKIQSFHDMVNIIKQCCSKFVFKLLY